MLVSGSCKETHLLLIMDDESEHLVHLVEVLANVASTLLSTQIIRQQSLLELHLPAHHVRGDLVTAVLIFRKFPSYFLQQLDSNRKWNPKYLVLICLDEQLNTTGVLSFPVIQRSEFVFLLQGSVKLNMHHIGAFTSLPLQTDSRGKRLLKAPLGVWKEDQFSTRESVFPERFESFDGHELQLSTWCDDTPFLYFDKNGVCTGQNLDTLDIIANKYNFTYDLQIKPEDGLWAYKENETWFGLLGGLEHGGKDLAINSFFLNRENFHDFDMVYPYQVQGFAFLIILPRPLPNWRKLLYPFTVEVWVAVMCCALLAPSLLGLFVRWFNPVQDTINLVIKVIAIVFSLHFPNCTLAM